jgi:hypothetical protein
LLVSAGVGGVSKSAALGGTPDPSSLYQIVLYNRALSPEKVPLKGRRVIRHGEYELECWVLPGSHMLRFEYKTLCTSELLIEEQKTPAGSGVVASFLCAGERDFEHKFSRDRVNYIATVQTERLSANLYEATFEEMATWARESPSRPLTHVWSDDVGPCLSIIDVQTQRSQVHVQAYHLRAEGGLVLRTQTIFEHY